jgi:hypothetical protein
MEDKNEPAIGSRQSAIISGGARLFINSRNREPFTIADSRFTNLPENKTAPVMYLNGCNQAVCFQRN